MMALPAVILLTGLIVLIGCEKSEPAEPAQTQAVAAAEAIEQTTCPIMGNPINKELFVEYKGKKVYFCCAGCIDKFKEDPEKYITFLKQRVTCPVSGEEIAVGDAAGIHEHDGKTYYFCCLNCKEAFLKDPAKYIK